jgi:hypothetical protein
MNPIQFRFSNCLARYQSIRCVPGGKKPRVQVRLEIDVRVGTR